MEKSWCNVHPPIIVMFAAIIHPSIHPRLRCIDFVRERIFIRCRLSRATLRISHAALLHLCKAFLRVKMSCCSCVNARLSQARAARQLKPRSTSSSCSGCSVAAKLCLFCSNISMFERRYAAEMSLPSVLSWARFALGHCLDPIVLVHFLCYMSFTPLAVLCRPRSPYMNMLS